LEIATSLKAATEIKEKNVSENKLSYEARKELSRKIKKAEKAVDEVEKLVAALESEISKMDALLQLPEKASDNDFIMLYQKKQREMEQKVYEWEILSEELEQLISEQ
jgi:ATP-binding cassette, subfamily F, member 3